MELKKFIEPLIFNEDIIIFKKDVIDDLIGHYSNYNLELLFKEEDPIFCQ